MSEQPLDLTALRTGDLVRFLRDPQSRHIAIPRAQMQQAYRSQLKELVASQRLEELERVRAKAQQSRIRLGRALVAARRDLDEMREKAKSLRRLLERARAGLTFVDPAQISNPLPPYGDEGTVSFYRFLDIIDAELKRTENLDGASQTSPHPIP